MLTDLFAVGRAVHLKKGVALGYDVSAAAIFDIIDRVTFHGESYVKLMFTETRRTLWFNTCDLVPCLVEGDILQYKYYNASTRDCVQQFPYDSSTTNECLRCCALGETHFRKGEHVLFTRGIYAETGVEAIVDGVGFGDVKLISPDNRAIEMWYSDTSVKRKIVNKDHGIVAGSFVKLVPFIANASSTQSRFSAYFKWIECERMLQVVAEDKETSRFFIDICGFQVSFTPDELVLDLELPWPVNVAPGDRVVVKRGHTEYVVMNLRRTSSAGFVAIIRDQDDVVWSVPLEDIKPVPPKNEFIESVCSALGSLRGEAVSITGDGLRKQLLDSTKNCNVTLVSFPDAKIYCTINVVNESIEFYTSSCSMSAADFCSGVEHQKKICEAFVNLKKCRVAH